LTVVDTSFVFALVSRGDAGHEAAVAWYGRSPARLETTPLVVAELDHLLRRWASEQAISAVLAQLESGGLEVAWWGDALAATLEVVRRRPDIGMVDASLVALAAHRNTSRIGTFDERHFRSLEPLTGEGAFTLLPADAD